MTVLFKTDIVSWEMNESRGFRRIGVAYKGNNIMAVISNKVLGEWKSQVVPMGYTYGIDDIEVMCTLYPKLPYLMQFIERDVDLTHDEMLEFLSNIQ